MREFARRRVAVHRDATTTRSSRRAPRARARPRPWPRCSPTRATPPSGAATVPGRRAAVPAALPGRPTSPTSSRSCARPRPRRSAGCSARHVAAAGHHRPRRRRLHHLHPRPVTDPDRQDEGAGHHMTTIDELNPELEGIGRYEFGWADTDVAGAGRQARPQRGRRPRHLRQEERAAVDARPAPEGPQALRPQADADLGRRPRRRSTSTTSSTSSAPPRSRRPAWEDLPEDIKNTYDKLGIPEAEKQRLVAGVAAQYESEVVYHSIREDLEEQGVIFLDTDTALREHAELFKEYFGTVIPVGDNKFAALNTSVWSGGSFIYVPPGRPRRHPAAGLLPDQHREHGPVRADADHRRRGRLRALRRGLHRADLLLGLAALRGRRDHREEGRPLPLHDHPELVEQRLQPRHQARHLRGRRDHGVGRRQHRLQGDDEVPRRLPDGRARQGRDAVDRLRRRGPAPGRRRQDGARGAAHLALDPLQVGGARRRADVVPRPDPDQRGRPRLASPTCCATRCWSTRSAAPTPTPTSTSARTTCRWATRRPSPRSATTSSST